MGIQGDVSVVDFDEIYTYASVIDTYVESDRALPQMSAINFWGQVGKILADEERETAMMQQGFDTYTIYWTSSQETWWYQFSDLNPGETFGYGSPRTVNSSATCSPLAVFAQGSPDQLKDVCSDQEVTSDSIYSIAWSDSNNHTQCLGLPSVPSTNTSFWLSNYTSFNHPSCGPRCLQMLVFQEHKADELGDLWQCNNTVGTVLGATKDHYADPTPFTIPDTQARIIAGAIGWSGVSDEVSTTNGEDAFQINRVLGDEGTPYAVDARSTPLDVASQIMRFTMGAIAAMDQLGGPRANVTGLYPSIPLVMHVKWWQAAPILVGLPLVQLLMLFGVVWYSGKAIILEPSYLTAAHLLYPVMQKLGKQGVLMTVDEMTEMMGREFKVAYSVRPNTEDPGYYNKDFVRDLALVEQSEGFGYIRGRMPEGRYD